MKLGKAVTSFLLAYCLIAFFSLLSAGSASATTYTITFGGVSFSPNSLNVNTGDTIVWAGAFSAHVIESTSVPSGAAHIGPSSTSDNSFSYIVTVAGTYNYQCNIHYMMGMTGSFTATTAQSTTKAFTLSANSVNFPPLRAGASANQTITFNSTGPDAAITISSSPLSIGTMFTHTPSGTNRSIAVNSSETQTFTFSPTGRGNFYDTLTINTDATTASDQVKKIPISGTGINGVYSGATTVAFDKVRVGTNKQITYVVTNSGDDTLFLSNPGITGTGFTIVSGSAQNILPNGTANIVLRFSPTAKQNYSGGLTMTAENNVTVPAITLSGIGTSPLLTPLPASSYDMGLVRVGGTLSGSIQVTNTGDDTLHVTGISIPNTQQGAKFTLTSATSFNLLPAAVTNITFTYTSSSESTDAATLNLTGDDGAGARQIALNAKSGLPKMSVNIKDTIDFGSVRIGTPAAAFLTINNVGSYDLAVQVSDFSPSVFSLTSLSATISPQGNGQAALSFTPTAEGTVIGMAVVKGNDNVNPDDTVYLKGTGINTALDFPASVDFHQLNINKSRDTVLKLVNHGSASAKMFKFSLADPDKGFVLVDTAAHTIAPNDSVSIKVRFSPTKEISYSGTVTIVTDDGAAPVRQIALAGIGINSKLSMNPSAIDFGTIDSGLTSTKTFTVTNTGSAQTSLTNVKTTGDLSFSLETLTFPIVIDAGAKKDISVTFAPKANGTFDGTAVVTATEGSPLSVSLHGKGHVNVVIGSVARTIHDIGLKMQLYPNPSKGSATIKLSLEKSLTITLGLFDAAGKLVQEFRQTAYSAGESTLALASESLPTGEYYLRAISEKTMAAELKVLIVR